ncbi:tRNA (cytosine(38)-C(5))-methyltransferase-like [Dysidea avara]|uniref:tRNA (cytosine(38)-C(5))-methyltransferase-like n=1 Tax=Dysidea avara TaxID=196820 RepID=UPI003322AF0E
MEHSPLRVLEFYSGIGGLHYALMSSGVEASVVAAFDINTSANHVYRSNFPRTPLCQRNICGLTVEYIEQLRGDVFLMSPPCQPFTRQGNKADDKDNRTNSFLHLLDVLLKLVHKPGHVLIENVQGFEVSATRDHLITVLMKCRYTYQEFLLTPTQFGIPNSRMRYYLLAKLTPLKFHFTTTDKPMTILPDGIDGITEPCVAPLCNFIQPMSCSEEDKLLVPPEVLLRYASILDIVQEDSTQCCCFTKAYGHYVEGTGSVLQCNSDGNLEEAFREYLLGGKKSADSLVKLRLRYFSSAEVAGLLWFPAQFQFPCNVTSKQQYRLLGNSLNVHVVSVLLYRILFNDCDKTT